MKTSTMIGTRVDTKVLQVMVRDLSLTMMLISHHHFFAACFRISNYIMPGFKGTMALATPAANVGIEPKGRESSEDNWENMR